MSVHENLELGEKYSKKYLAELLNEGGLSTVREGVFGCKNSDSYFLFIDLEKEGKEDRFHFNDFYEGEFFHWDSQTTQHIDSPKIQSVVNGVLETFLFVRITQKIKGQTQPFIYCGRVNYSEHDASTAKPVHIVFQNIDYDDYTENEDLTDIYLWKPEKAGMTSRPTILKKGMVSSQRKANYTKPTTTERKGLVTSRVGQGYFRNQLIEKFDAKCAVTKTSIRNILIASHIVPWSEATEEERLDKNNGILLSPLYDALFDKHLISFQDDGEIIISAKVGDELNTLQVDQEAKIKINDEMKPYLQRHRNKLK
ncbi:MAG TPA: DUF3427 domain-containing protein [Gammaproteobacteria bacterium]|jgi:hypothetical protein|nr:DUF3427 domain-containing protein [Gammaproteobacteria bacterium]